MIVIFHSLLLTKIAGIAKFEGDDMENINKIENSWGATTDWGRKRGTAKQGQVGKRPSFDAPPFVLKDSKLSLGENYISHPHPH